MKRMEIIKDIVFLILLVIMLLVVNNIFILKGEYPNSINWQLKQSESVLGEVWNGYYAKDRNTIDMLFFGTSTMYCAVDNNLLYHDYGITSYDLSGNQQKLAYTYYYLKEALQYQHPSVVFIEVHSGILKEEVTSTVSAHYQFDYMRNGLVKQELMENTIIESPQSIEFPFLDYHSRWQELSENDFTYLISDKKNLLNGHFIYYPTLTCKEAGAPPICEKSDKTLNDLGFYETQEYLDKIVELCEEENITCVLFKIPCSYDLLYDEEYYSNYLDAVALYAEEKHIQFWDFNQEYEEIGLDLAKDSVDGFHFNLEGSIKFTKYLGETINQNIDIYDRRGVEGYEEWDTAFEYESILIQDCYIGSSRTLEESGSYWQNNDNLVTIVIAEKASYSAIKDQFCSLENLGFEGISEINSGELYIGILDDNECTIVNNLIERDTYDYENNGVTISVSRIANRESTILIQDEFIRNKGKEFATVNIIVYDKTLDRVIDWAYVRKNGILTHEGMISQLEERKK